MKTKSIVVLVMLFVLAGIGFYWLSLNQEETTETASPLVEHIDACDWIAEKSAMGLPETLPFQRLEKRARVIRVFEICMQDRGFIENADWVNIAERVAKQKSAEQDISMSEAYENIRRVSMLQHTPPEGTPYYWVKTN